MNLKKLYIRFTGYSYTNLGRLFLRLFIGVMLMQFGVRQLYNFDAVSALFPSVLGMAPEVSLIVMICIELGCSLFIMAGFFTRLMCIPPIVAMTIAEAFLISTREVGAEMYQLDWQVPVYLPIMFIGVYLFIWLVGPGKISVDYFLSLHLIHTADASEEELEEV